MVLWCSGVNLFWNLGGRGSERKKFNFSRKTFKKFRFFQALSQEIRFSGQELAIYSYFWANYSSSLQKSPLL